MVFTFADVAEAVTPVGVPGTVVTGTGFGVAVACVEYPAAFCARK